MKKLLITNGLLNSLGGSESWTYTLVSTAINYGCDVDVWSPRPGFVLDRMVGEFNVGTKIQESYDLCLCNHFTTIPSCYGRGKIIQTCHGIFPSLEQPHYNANVHVAITEEVKKHIIKQMNRGDVPVIYNMIDLSRFKKIKPISDRPKKILSLSQNDLFNRELIKSCKKRDLKLIVHNKFVNPIWEIEQVMNEVDVVISLGRGAYEAISTGRPVLIADQRSYQGILSDGMLTSKNIDELILKNCAGRTKKLKYTADELITLMLEEYDPEDGDKLMEWSNINLDSKKQFIKYLNLI